MSIDPWGGEISDPQSLNKYAYARNNPMTFIDFWGLAAALVVSGDEFRDGRDFDAFHKKAKTRKDEMEKEEAERAEDGDELLYEDGVFHVDNLEELMEKMEFFEEQGIEVSYFEYYGHGDKDGLYFSKIVDREGEVIGYEAILSNTAYEDKQVYPGGKTDYLIQELPKIMASNVFLRLNSCNTANGFAQQLATHFEVYVTAPNIEINFLGHVPIIRPDRVWTRGGKWITFDYNGEKVQ